MNTNDYMRLRRSLKAPRPNPEPPPEPIHIRQHGGERDKRFGTVRYPRATKGRSNLSLCGLDLGTAGLSQANAQGLVRMVPFFHFPNTTRTREDYERLCPACLALLPPEEA